jgi:hypothetical protein
MAWPSWPKTDEKGLARYVCRDIAGQLRLKVVRDDLLARGERRELLEAIYAELLKSDIRYARELFDPTLDVQLIRDPKVILKGAGDGTCLDLALFFAGLCLGNELLPLIVVLDGHALVAVSLVDGRRDAGNPRRRDADRDGSWVEEGLLKSGEMLRQLVDRDDYLAIECTGFARSEEISPAMPEGKGRNKDGLMTFTRAIEAGREQLGPGARAFAFAIDVAMLQDVLHFAEIVKLLPDENVKKILAALDARGETARAAEAGVERSAILELARRLKPDEVLDFDQAVLELTAAVGIAVEVSDRGARGSNLGDLVNTVLAGIAAKTRAGDIEGATRDADRGFAEWEHAEAERRATSIRSGIALLEAGLDQDILRRDALAAARRVERIVALEYPNDATARFAAMCERQDAFYARGRDKGVNFDLLIAIEIARLALHSAQDAQQRGTAQNNLGIALTSLGARESGTARLEEAVAAYRAALMELTRERVPLDWARSFGNEGIALIFLAERRRDATTAKTALTQINTAFETMRDGGDASGAAYFEQQLSEARVSLARLRGADR